MVNPQYDNLFTRSLSVKEKSPSFNLLKPLLVILATISVTIFLVIYNHFNVEPTEGSISSEKQDAVPSEAPKSLIPILKKSPAISQKDMLTNVQQIMDPIAGTYSVYVYDFDSHESYGVNEHTIFVAASITKVQILSALYLLAQERKINLDDTVTIQANDIQDYGTGIIRYEGKGKTYSYKSLAKLMMEKSDNTAAYVLATQVIGYKKLTGLIDEWSLEQTDMVKNNTSNYDMSQMFRMLYQEELIKSPNLKEMFDFMKDTDFEDRIPQKLPPGTVVYHKTGDQVAIAHDTGIVDIPKHDYYIGILTSNLLKDEIKAKEALADVSKIIYDYQIQL